MALTAVTVLSTVTLIKDSLTNPFTPIVGTGTNNPLTFSISPSLPSGLSLDTNSGAISGLPTQLANVLYSVTVDDASTASTATFSLNVQSEIVPYLKRIADSLETVTDLTQTTGVRTAAAYDWILPTEIYSWYNQDLSTLVNSTATLGRLVSNITTITNNMPKFI